MASNPPGYKPAKRRGHEFTPDEIDRALTALALTGGNAVRATRLLAQDETLTRTPSPDALYVWRDKYADRYAEIQNQRAPQIEAAAIHDWRAIVSEGTRAQLEATRRATAGLDEINGHEAARVAKDLAIATAVAADKLLVFTDRPNNITERRDPSELLRAIDVITGTAVEIEDSASDNGSTLSLIDESPTTNARELEPPAA